MTYSYTQISQYLCCPRRYRYRYLDGWQEKETRAAMLFGRVFEQALGAYFRGQDSSIVLFQEWQIYQNQKLEYAAGDSWDRMLQQGVQLLERFAQEDRVHIARPDQDLQIKIARKLKQNDDFLAYIDAIGALDGKRCLIEWKTSGSRYPEQAAELLSLDPQLVCYSWITNIADVAMVVFVRKRLVDIQYLQSTISEAQRQEFASLVAETIGQIEQGRFLPHTGIRFPQSGCLHCPYLGLCLNRQDLIDAKLLRRPGAERLDWLDQLDY